MLKQLHTCFESMVEIPRIRRDKRQTLETLINEEAFLLAEFLRDGQKQWVPRITPK